MYLNALESQSIPDTDTLSLIYLPNQARSTVQSPAIEVTELDGVETFLEHYKKNCLCNKKTIVTVRLNKPFSIWVNLHFCTFIFLPFV